MDELYKDHSEIISKIPDYFYAALLGEIVSMLGTWVIGYAKEYGDLDSSTYGWHCALQQACNKLDLNWIIDYRNTLEWYDSDTFDGRLEAKCCELIVEYDHEKDEVPDTETIRNIHNNYYRAASKPRYCKMCCNASVESDLTPDNDLSYISVGETSEGINMCIRTGNAKPTVLLVSKWDSVLSRNVDVGLYKMKFCPECGRRLVENAEHKE